MKIVAAAVHVVVRLPLSGHLEGLREDDSDHEETEDGRGDDTGEAGVGTRHEAAENSHEERMT